MKKTTDGVGIEVDEDRDYFKDKISDGKVRII